MERHNRHLRNPYITSKRLIEAVQGFDSLCSFFYMQDIDVFNAEIIKDSYDSMMQAMNYYDGPLIRAKISSEMHDRMTRLGIR